MLFKKSVLKSEFSRYVLTLVVGSSIAQLVPILISPILTRVYSPDVFGSFSVFLAIVTILSGFSNGRYDVAIVQARRREDANNIFFLGFSISLIFCLILLLVIFLFKGQIALLDENHLINDFIYLIPLAVFFTSFFSLLNYFNTREKFFYDIKNANIIRSFVMSATQISVGLIQNGIFGLIIGLLFSQVFSITKLLKNILRNLNLSEISLGKMLKLAKEYKNYPLFSVWGGVLNSASMHLPIVILSNFYGLKVAGLYALAIRVVGFPLSIIGGSLGQVFYQKSCDIRDNFESLSAFTFGIYKNLLKVAIIPFAILVSSGDILFVLIFGKEWEIAGIYVRFLALWFLFVLCSSPLSSILDVLSKQKQGLYFQICIFIARILAVFIGGTIFSEAYYTVLVYGIIGFIFWAAFCIYLLRLVNIAVLATIKVTAFYVLLGIFLAIIIRLSLSQIGL